MTSPPNAPGGPDGRDGERALPVAEDAGAVTIGGPTGAPAGLAGLSLRGGTLLVDPTAAGAPPRFRVGDPADLDVAVHLYGGAAVDAVRGARPTIPLTQSPDRDALVRLAVTRWLARTLVVPLDLPLLRLEVATTAASLAGLLDPDEEPVQDLLDLLDDTLTWSERALEPGTAWRSTPAVVVALTAALAAMRRHLPMSDPRHQQITQRLGALTGTSAGGTPTVDPTRGGRLDRLTTELQPAGAADLGGPADLRTWSGAAAAGWDRVPADVSRAEHAVTWKITATSRGAVLSVVVDAAADPPHARLLTTRNPASGSPADAPAATLQATLYHDRWPLPLAVCELHAAPETRSWMGNQPVLPNLADRLTQWPADGATLDVHSPSVRRPPPRGVQAQAAQAIRWSARGLTAARLAAASPAAPVRDLLTTNARAAFNRAARLYAPLPGHADQARAATGFAANADAPQPRPRWRPSPSSGDPSNTVPMADLTSVTDLITPTAAEAWYTASLAGPG